MPYVFVDELQEGQEEAQVVEKGEHDELSRQLEEAREQRDKAIERAETAEKGWQEAKEKYANTFLTTPSKIKESNEIRVKRAQSVRELFNPRKEN